MATYEEFAEAFFEALAKTKDNWTVDEQGNLTNSRENTQQVLSALRSAAGAIGNIGLLVVLTRCEH